MGMFVLNECYFYSASVSVAVETCILRIRASSCGMMSRISPDCSAGLSEMNGKTVKSRLNENDFFFFKQRNNASQCYCTLVYGYLIYFSPLR